MILKLKYFGMIAEAIAKNEEPFDFSGNSVADLETELYNCYSALESLNYTFAVNQNIVDKNEVLKDNDEVALLPPFAGG